MYSKKKFNLYLYRHLSSEGLRPDSESGRFVNKRAFNFFQITLTLDLRSVRATGEVGVPVEDVSSSSVAVLHPPLLILLTVLAMLTVLAILVTLRVSPKSDDSETDGVLGRSCDEVFFSAFSAFSVAFAWCRKSDSLRYFLE